MKRFWSKLIFRETPARGVFFALTLWGAGLYLLGSLLFAGWVCGWVGGGNEWPPIQRGCDLRNLWIPLAASLVLPLYFLWMTVRFCRSRRLGLMFGLILVAPPMWVLLLPVVNVLGGPFPALRNGWNSGLFFLLLPLLLLFCGSNWKWAAAALVSWGLGLLMCIVASNGMMTWGALDPSQQWLAEQTRFLGVAGWAVWGGAALLLLLAGYLFSAKLIAVSGEVRFRSLFGKPVLVCWGVAAIVYLTFTVMAFSADWKADRRLQALEKQFGRPLTPEALEKFYYRDGRGDAAFWAEMEQRNLKEAIPESEIPPKQAVFSSGQLAQIRGKFEKSRNRQEEWEKAFSGPIPHLDLNFRRGQLFFLEFPNLWMIRKFDRLEMWRIRFALADGDFGTALAAYERIGAANRALGRELFLIGGLVWVSCEDLRLDALELLLESNRLSGEQLRRFSQELSETEERIPQVQERAMYGEAVGLLDAIDLWNSGHSQMLVVFPFSKEACRLVSRKSFFLFFPQLRWWNGLDTAEAFGQYATPPQMDSKPGSHAPRLLSSFCAPMGGILRRFTELTARVRAMRGLIAAELYQREHGEYPEKMADLPLDPFSGKPLLYGKGEFRMVVAEKPPAPDDWKHRPHTIPVSAVQVWSVGQNGKDDNGLNIRFESDDVRAIRRISP